MSVREGWGALPCGLMKLVIKVGRCGSSGVREAAMSHDELLDSLYWTTHPPTHPSSLAAMLPPVTPRAPRPHAQGFVGLKDFFLLLLLFIYIFSIVGMQQFGGHDAFSCEKVRGWWLVWGSMRQPRCLVCAPGPRVLANPLLPPSPGVVHSPALSLPPATRATAGAGLVPRQLRHAVGELLHGVRHPDQ